MDTVNLRDRGLPSKEVQGLLQEHPILYMDEMAENRNGKASAGVMKVHRDFWVRG